MVTVLMVTRPKEHNLSSQTLMVGMKLLQLLNPSSSPPPRNHFLSF